jgi:hypothetical protein
VIAGTEQQMADFDRSIAEAERGFEQIRRDLRKKAFTAISKTGGTTV